MSYSSTILTYAGYGYTSIGTLTLTQSDFAERRARYCRHQFTACVQVGRRHCEIVCVECGDALARYRFEPELAPVVLREPPPAADVPRAPTVHRVATQRRHRASPRRFTGASA